jgi:hypothetical protein
MADTTQAQAEAEAKAEAQTEQLSLAEGPALPSFDVTRHEDGTFLITTNALGALIIRTALYNDGMHQTNVAVGEQQQIDNPSFMNPQPALHAEARDMALRSRQVLFDFVRQIEPHLLPEGSAPSAIIENIERVELRGPQLGGAQAQKADVTGPAEVNRPNSARRGATST